MWHRINSVSIDIYLLTYIPRRRIYDCVNVVNDTRLRKNRIQYRLAEFFLYVREGMKKREISFKRKGRDRSILDGCTWARDKSGCHAEFILLLFYNGFLSQTLSTRCNSTQFPDSACIPNKTESGSQNISLIHSCKSIFKVEIFNFFFSLTIEKDSPIGLARRFSKPIHVNRTLLLKSWKYVTRIAKFHTNLL